MAGRLILILPKTCRKTKLPGRCVNLKQSEGAQTGRTKSQ